MSSTLNTGSVRCIHITYRCIVCFFSNKISSSRLGLRQKCLYRCRWIKCDQGKEFSPLDVNSPSSKQMSPVACVQVGTTHHHPSVSSGRTGTGGGAVPVHGVCVAMTPQHTSGHDEQRGCRWHPGRR